MGRQRKTIRNKRKIGVSNYQNQVLDASEARTQISKNFSRELKLTIVSIFIVVIIMISSAFAIFSSIQKSKNYNTLTVGTLQIDFNDKDEGTGNIINLNGAYPESDEAGLKEEPYIFKITNTGTLEASYKVKIVDDLETIEKDNCSTNLLNKENIRVSINGETPFTLSEKQTLDNVVKTGTLKPNQSEKYEIRIWIDENSSNEVLGKHYHGKIVVEGVNTKNNGSESSSSSVNKNIVSAYTYNQETGQPNYCVTGNESTCEETTCYQNKDEESCPAGTIINYKVNNEKEVRFHVVQDDGETMRLQSQKDTLNNNAWYSTDPTPLPVYDTGDNSHGPTTALDALESATADWTNVKDQTYSIGSSSNNTNLGYSGCHLSGGYNASGSIPVCDSETYSLSRDSVKARMITVQEAHKVGCAYDNKTCPIWIYNFLKQSTKSGGTDDDKNSKYYYWTMSAFDGESKYAWAVYNQGRVYFYNLPPEGNSVRALVVVSKNNI